MAGKHTVFCGGAKRSGKLRAADRELSLWGDDSNMMLDSASLEHSLAATIPARLQDLLEIAAYVYVADQAFDRGDETGADLGARWRREIRFLIGVRDPDFWSGANVRSLLSDTIAFVSNDRVAFEFEAAKGMPPQESRLPLSTGPSDWYRGAKVLAFSGGLDSLAGAVEQIFGDNRNLALVTHRAATKLDPIQRGLASALRVEARNRKSEQTLHHFPVWVRKTEGLDREATQRTRSFLFAALGGVVARLIGADELNFFENGVISLNLPVCAQVLDARATRTTHPKTLMLFERLLTTVFGAPFTVQNPFLWKTKAEVIRILQDHHCEKLIAESVSCSHTIEMTGAARHCGTCSQCIDRRVGVLAAGAAEHDPASGYRSELFGSVPDKVEDQTMRETYVLRAREIRTLDDRTFFTRFGEVSRVLPSLPGSPEANAQQILALYRRHADEVARVLADELSRQKEVIVNGTLPSKSLLAMVLPQQRDAVKRGTSKEKQVAPGRAQRMVRVLHISDTHFSSKAWDQDDVLSALARDVQVHREARGAPDLIIFTGDIAQSGKAAEYKAAERWIVERLLPAAASTPSQLVLVPGNHDVDRSKVRMPGKALHQALLSGKDQNAIAEVLGDSSQRQPLLDGHDAWLKFSRRLNATPTTVNVPWSSRVFDVRGSSVRVATLCSSWCAYSDSDHGRLLVGRYQIVQALDSQEADLTIAALHHPWAMIAEFDAGVVREAVFRRCDIILRGHLHAAAAERIVRPDTQTLEIAAGASYAGSSHSNAYQWIEVDLERRRVRVYLRTWDGFDWIEDRNAYGGNAKDGYAEFPLQVPAKKVGYPKSSRLKATKER